MGRTQNELPTGPVARMEEQNSGPTGIAAGPVLLYDGLCGFCDWTVQFVLARDRAAVMRFAPLQGDFATQLIARHPRLQSIDSLILVETEAGAAERISVRSEAVLRIGELIGGGWQHARLLRIVPRPIRDLAYNAFARIRYRVFGHYENCPIPAAEVRTRFIA